MLEDLKRFVAKVNERLPKTSVYFVSNKLSPFRRGRWAAMKMANHLVEGFANSHGEEDLKPM